jgi:hypothetical protein
MGQDMHRKLFACCAAPSVHHMNSSPLHTGSEKAACLLFEAPWLLMMTSPVSASKLFFDHEQPQTCHFWIQGGNSILSAPT